MVTATVEEHRWTRAEYERMAEDGYFGDRRVELIDGVIYDMAPQKSPHAAGIAKCVETLLAVFSNAGCSIRPQLPLALDAQSMPEPDVAVVPGKADDYVEAHPTSAVLVVEVADSSEPHDRKRKVGLYARAGIPEYWIVNLVRDYLEVYRDPAEGGYRTHQVLRRGERIAPLARPESPVAVEDLLPRRS